LDRVYPEQGALVIPRGKEAHVTRILIVDDDPDIAEAARLVLEREGYEVASATNRRDGMEALVESPPDLLILDVMMEEPDDGLRMAHDIRRGGNTVPIMMLTSINATMGFTADKDDEMVPVDAFHSKPIDPRVLVAAVRALLENRG
jgi:DNA-binding response OmpR family regulator